MCTTITLIAIYGNPYVLSKAELSVSNLPRLFPQHAGNNTSQYFIISILDGWSIS